MLFCGYRTASVSCFGIFVIFQISQKKARNYLFVFLTIIFAAALLLKQNSTSGRWFITKRTVEMISAHPMGIGPGNFKTTYGILQEAYFRTHEINTSNALLADNTEFALNEYLQITAEGGLLFGLLFFCFIFFTIWMGLKIYKKTKSNFILACLAGFVGVSVASLTFYMLHNWWVLCFFSTCALGIYLTVIKSVHIAKSICFSTLSLSFIICSCSTFLQERANKQINEAIELSNAGYRTIADSLLGLLPKSIEYGLPFQWAQARHKINYGDFQAAKVNVLNAMKISCNDGIYILAGDIFLLGMDTLAAIIFYEKAIFLVPKRFISRQKLAAVYEMMHDSTNEQRWLNSIINLPEKVPSEITNKIKIKARIRLEELQND
jgi:hypothetical protein